MGWLSLELNTSYFDCAADTCFEFWFPRDATHDPGFRLPVYTMGAPESPPRFGASSLPKATLSPRALVSMDTY